MKTFPPIMMTKVIYENRDYHLLTTDNDTKLGTVMAHEIPKPLLRSDLRHMAIYAIVAGREFYGRPKDDTPAPATKVYVLTEVWGTGIDEVAVSVYGNRAAGYTAFRKCVTEYLDGSPRDPDEVLEKCGDQFTHSDGFIRLDEEVVNVG